MNAQRTFARALPVSGRWFDCSVAFLPPPFLPSYLRTIKVHPTMAPLRACRSVGRAVSPFFLPPCARMLTAARAITASLVRFCSSCLLLFCLSVCAPSHGIGWCERNSRGVIA